MIRKIHTLTTLTNLILSLSGLIVVIFTTLIYFVIFVYLSYTLEALNDHECSPTTIASFSLIFSMLASSVTSGAFLGRIAPSHPSRYAIAVGSAFMLLQLWQLALFQGIPVWLTILTILSYPPCCAYAAMRAAGRRTPTGHTTAPTVAPPAAAASAAAPEAKAAAAAPPESAVEIAAVLPAAETSTPPGGAAMGAAGNAPAAQGPSAAGGGGGDAAAGLGGGGAAGAEWRATRPEAEY